MENALLGCDNCFSIDVSVSILMDQMGFGVVLAEMGANLEFRNA